MRLLDIIKSKRYTYTRICRIMLYVLLGITKNDMMLSKNSNNMYARVLGMNQKGKELLSVIKGKDSNVPIITKVSDFCNECKNPDVLNLFKKDILATDIYTMAYGRDSFSGLDYTNKMVII